MPPRDAEPHPDQAPPAHPRELDNDTDPLAAEDSEDSPDGEV